MSKNLCKECKFFNPVNSLCIVKGGIVSTAESGCPINYIKPKTVFQQITSSPEVLAENLIHCIWYPTGRRWISTIIVWKEFENKSEAVAATVAKLKEVEK